MPQNYAEKYGKGVIEAFTPKLKTESAMGKEKKHFDFTGANTVKLYNVPTAPLNDYNRTASSNRYGSRRNVGTTIDEYILSQQRSFSEVIDRLDNQESNGVLAPAQHLARVLREQVRPEMEQYRLATMFAAAEQNSNVITGDIDSSNAYEAFLELNGLLSEEDVPTDERTAFISSQFYQALKTSNLIIDSEYYAKKRTEGGVGMVEDVELKIATAKDLPTGAHAILAHKSGTVSPVTLESFHTHENPPGIEGWLIEGVVRYDAFAVQSRINGLAALAAE